MTDLLHATRVSELRQSQTTSDSYTGATTRIGCLRSGLPVPASRPPVS